ncbi:MAG: alpha/beta fold hydrolase BchO [Erythrobacter sp.]
MSAALNWDREGRIWPNREASRFVDVGAARWHLQRMGAGGTAAKPQMLLLHGTGASVHSWRAVMPLLAENFDVLAPDLPRQGFTRGHPPDAMSLPRMATAIADLLDAEKFDPAVVVGHSAGAAIGLQMALDHGFDGPIVGLNSALRPFPGPAAQIFPAVAKLLFVNPLVPRLFSGMASLTGDTRRFLQRATNSRIDEEGLACYTALLQNSRHTEGALAMMANWDLPGLRARMGEIENPVLLVHSDNDAAIPLDWAREADGWLPDSRLEVLEGLGHLAHEEDPREVARRIEHFAKEHLAKAR